MNIRARALLILVLAGHASARKQLRQTQKVGDVVKGEVHQNDIRGHTPLEAQSKAVYSAHKCQGEMAILAAPPADGVRNTTCRFQNVCYDMASDEKKLMYFTQSTGTEDMLNAFASLDLRPMSQSDCNPAVRLPIHVINEPIPAGATIWPHAVTVLFQPFGSENFGHEVGDDMYAVYVMQQLFHTVNPYDSQLMTLDSCDRPEIDGANRTKCIQMMAKLYPAISRHPVLQLQASALSKAYRAPIAVAQDKTSLVCFPNLIAGSGAHSFRSPTVGGQSQMYFAYRSFVLRNTLEHCANGMCDAATSGRKTILIAKKTEFNHVGMGAGILNTKALQRHLSRAFPEHDVLVRDLAHLSFNDQLALVARTTVMFSHSGGGSFSGMFLPPGATLAILTKEGKKKQPYWMNLEVNFWKSLHWLTFRNVEDDLTTTLAEQIVTDALDTAEAAME